MKAKTALAKKATSTSGNFDRDRRIKKVGKAPHHKPKYRKDIFTTEN